MKTTSLLALLMFLIAPAQAHAADPPAPSADAYLAWVLDNTRQVDDQLPAITAAAEDAAAAFIAGKDLGVRGGALAGELGARAGGLTDYRQKPGVPGDIILYAFGVATVKSPDPATLLDQEIADAQKLADAGSLVIGIASLQQLESLGKLDAAKKACRHLIDNRAPAADGLFIDKSGKPIIPTFVVANAIVGWTWTGELFSACTRAGKTPAMNQSTQLDGARERNLKYQKQRFHDDITVTPIAPGLLGRQYLTTLRALVESVRDHGRGNLLKAARIAADTLRDGGKVYIGAWGHYPPQHHGGQLPADPGLFTRLNVGRNFPAEPGENDFTIIVGYSWGPGSPLWGKPELLQKSGRGTAWILTGYALNPADFRANDIWIDQRWEAGDALVQPPGYDIKILPPSAITAETLLWSLTAATAADLAP